MSPYPEGSRKWLTQNPEHVIRHLETALKGKPGETISKTFMDALDDIFKAYKPYMHGVLRG